jgi:PASTA domain
MIILVVGSLRDPEASETYQKPDKQFVEDNKKIFQAACEALGGALARKKHTIMVGVPDWPTLENNETVATFIVEGASKYGIKNKKKKAGNGKKKGARKGAPLQVIFYGPQEREDQNHTPGLDTLEELKNLPNIKIVDKFEARGISKASTIPYIASVDAVMLISGRDGTASIGFAALAMEKPVITITSLQGAAESLRQDVLTEDYDQLIKQGYITANPIRDLDAYWDAEVDNNQEKADKVVAATEKIVEAYNLSKGLPEKKVVVDEQGRPWEIAPEKTIDRIVANISVGYLLAVLFFFLWQLFDVWTGQYTLLKWVRFPNIQILANATFHLAVYSFIGGALGGIINGLRSCLRWHTEYKAFGHQFLLKYIVAPWSGAVLGLFAFAFTKSGLAVFGGNTSTSTSNISQMLATFIFAVLAGYGSYQFFKWLDAMVSRFFKVATVKVDVPLLIGMTPAQVKTELQKVGLSLGSTKFEDQTDPGKIGKVIKQAPNEGKTVNGGSTVNITVGRSSA